MTQGEPPSITHREPTIGQITAAGVGLMVWCHSPGCRRRWTYLTCGEAAARFGTTTTLREATRRARCPTCGARGAERRVQVLASTLDQDEVRLGRAVPHLGAEVARRLAWGLSSMPGLGPEPDHPTPPPPRAS